MMLIIAYLVLKQKTLIVKDLILKKDVVTLNIEI